MSRNAPWHSVLGRSVCRNRGSSNMPIETVNRLCTPNAVVTSDSLVEQVAQIEDLAYGRVDGRDFFRRNHFTDGLQRLVERGFERLAGRSDDGAFYLTQAMGGGKTHSLIAFGLLAADPDLRREVVPRIRAGPDPSRRTAKLPADGPGRARGQFDPW